MVDPNQILEQGWKARENYEFEKAIVLITQAQQIFEKNNDVFMVSECLNHLALTYKMIAFTNNVKAIEYANQSYLLVKKNNVKKTLSLRTLSSVNKYASNYEQAIKYASQAVNLSKKAADRGDIRADLALCYLRTGDKEKASQEIDLAYNELEVAFDDINTVHKYIWQTKILMFRGLINYNLGKKDKAKEDFKLALQIASKHDLKMRLQEAKDLLELD